MSAILDCPVNIFNTNSINKIIDVRDIRRGEGGLQPNPSKISVFYIIMATIKLISIVHVRSSLIRFTYPKTQNKIISILY